MDKVGMNKTLICIVSSCLCVFFGVNVWIFERVSSNVALEQHHDIAALVLQSPLVLQEDALSYVRERSYGIGFYPRPWYELEEELGESLNSSVKKRSVYNRPDFALVTRKSNQHEFNQDRAALIQPFHTNQDQGREAKGEHTFLLVLLDGHAVLGDKLANYAREEIPRRLSEKLNSKPCCQPDSWIQQQLNETFLQVNQDAPPISALRGGSTASVTLRLGSKLYFANVGDSRTILAQYNASNSTCPSTIHYLTQLDKPHVPSERSRIESLGGLIHIPKKAPKQSRVVVYSVASIPHEQIALAMSRSLGDWEWKEDGVIAEPIVDVMDISKSLSNSHSSFFFVLAASDGVWDLKRPELFANRFGKILAEAAVEGSGKDKSSMLYKAAHDLILEVSPQNPKWYRDDMTAVVVKIL